MDLESFNIWLFTIINSLAGKNPYLDSFMIFLAQYLILIVPLYILYLFFNKKPLDRRLAVFLFISGIISVGISIIISTVYYHPRPFAMGIGTALIHHSADSSFPSDHTTLIFSFSLPFLYFKRYKESTIFIVISILIGYARVFCGVHFPFDILGGFVIAFVVSYILFIFRDTLFRLFFKNSYSKA